MIPVYELNHHSTAPAMCLFEHTVFLRVGMSPSQLRLAVLQRRLDLTKSALLLIHHGVSLTHQHQGAINSSGAVIARAYALPV